MSKKVLTVDAYETVVEHRFFNFDIDMWKRFIADWEVKTDATFEEAIEDYAHYNEKFICTYTLFNGDRSQPCCLVDLMNDYINEVLWNEVEVEDIDILETDINTNIEEMPE